MLFREVVTLEIHYVVQPRLTSTSYMQLCTYIVPFYFALHHSIPYPSSVIRDTLEPEHLFIHFVVVFLPAVHVVMIILLLRAAAYSGLGHNEGGDGTYHIIFCVVMFTMHAK